MEKLLLDQGGIVSVCIRIGTRALDRAFEESIFLRGFFFERKKRRGGTIDYIRMIIVL